MTALSKQLVSNKTKVMPSKSSSYDPRNAEFNGIKIDDWDSSQWKQWKPKFASSTTDYTAIAEREYLRVKYAVQQANQQLDIDKVRVKLKLSSPNAIALQGTFPCKPGDIGKNGSPNKQYHLSLGYGANDAGIKTAVSKARELDLQLTTKTFQWNSELLGKQAQKIVAEEKQSTKLIVDLIADYEKEYWKTREKNRKSIRTWENNYIKNFNKLPQNKPLSEQSIIEAIERTNPNSSSRKQCIAQIIKLCEFSGLDAMKIIRTYAVKNIQVKRRYPPTDSEILEGYNLVGTPLHKRAGKSHSPEQWQWIYGMLATYGLRPHEVFAIDLKAYLDPLNTKHLVYLNPTLTEGTKTGERECGIPPLLPEWVELFNLKQPKLFISNGSFYNRTGLIHGRFRTVAMKFRPYDLRHAYAIRGHRLRVPIKAMADFMGHSVEEHTKTYQKWMNKNTNIEIYEEVVIQKQTATKEELKARITELEAEVVKLRQENEVLRKQLVEQQLDDLLNL